MLQTKGYYRETNDNIDVLIVGAGPTGLALAYQLRRLGLSFRIIEMRGYSSGKVYSGHIYFSHSATISGSPT